MITAARRVNNVNHGSSLVARTVVYALLAALLLAAAGYPAPAASAQAPVQPSVTEIAVYTNAQCLPPPANPAQAFTSNSTGEVYLGATTDAPGQTVKVEVLNPAGQAVASAQAAESPDSYTVCVAASTSTTHQPHAGTWIIQGYVVSPTGQPQGYASQYFNISPQCTGGVAGKCTPEFPAGSWVALALALPVYLFVRRRLNASSAVSKANPRV